MREDEDADRWQPIGAVAERVVAQIVSGPQEQSMTAAGRNQPAWQRRYTFRLYPNPAQLAELHRHRLMIGELWNALLQRWEDVQRRTQQRQTWYDSAGKRHRGLSVHCPTWASECMADGRRRVMPADKLGRPKPMTAFDLQNEITWLANSLPEWRELSIWCGHRTAGLLMRAIEAFYRRARDGAGKAAGYPRYKLVDRHDSIPHRFASGCALDRDPRHERSWSVRLKGVTAPIHARGKLPGAWAGPRGGRMLQHGEEAAAEKFTDADVIWRNGKWWLSVAIELSRVRTAGRRPITVEFDGLAGLARVNGVGELPPGFDALYRLEHDLDALKSERDRCWPRGRRVLPEERDAHDELRQRIATLSARIARRRAHILHVWTARLIRQASALTIIAPEIRRHTRSARGDARNWGAAVDVVATLNRSVLGLAPASAISMLVYKAAEAGIACTIVDDAAPALAVSRTLIDAAKAQRRLRREIRNEGSEAA